MKYDYEITESVVVLAEVRAGVTPGVQAETIQAIIQAVASEYGIYVACVCLLEQRTILKTTSGKIARNANRKAFLEGGKTLKIVKRWDMLQEDGSPECAKSSSMKPENPCDRTSYEEVEAALIRMVSGLMLDSQAVPAVDVNFLDLGLTSQSVAQLASMMSVEFGISIRPTFAFFHPTIKETAIHVMDLLMKTRLRNVQSASNEVDNSKESATEEFENIFEHPYEGHIAAYGTSFPIPVSTEHFLKMDREVRTALGQDISVIEAMKQVSIASGIKNRHSCHKFFLEEGQSAEGLPGVVTKNIFENTYDPPYHMRSACYRESCVNLCIDAARKAVNNWGQDPKRITHIITTCTSGWEEPGIACMVMKALELSQDCQKAELNFNGCSCGATCLRLARDIIRAGNSTGVLIVACEVASSQVSWKSTEKQHLVAQCLFADGAAAIIVARDGLWRFEKTGSSVMPESSHLLGLRPPTNAGENSYHMTLSPYVASSLGAYFTKGHGKDLLKKMFNPAEQRPALAIHPGGPKILEAMGVVFGDLGWEEDALRSSFDTFENHGNLGSAAMLLVLADRLRKNDIKEDKLITMAFGPGVTVEWATYSRSNLNAPKVKSTNTLARKNKQSMLLFACFLLLLSLLIAVRWNDILK